MDTKVAFKIPDTSLGVDDLCNRGESILSGYKNEIARQLDETKKLKDALRVKEESLRRKNILIKEQDAAITQLNAKQDIVVKRENGECKNCDALRVALEEFQELIEKDFNLDSIKALLVEKDKTLVETVNRLAESERKLAESVESLEECKLKVASATTETFTLKREVRDLKRRIEFETEGDRSSPAFTNEYISSCKEALRTALDSVASTSPDIVVSGVENLKIYTETLCGYFKQLLGHCSTCSRQDQDSGIEESDSEKKTKSKYATEKVCDDCKCLRERYAALCSVNDRLVEALVKYEDMTLMLKVTSQDQLLWGRSFLRVMTMITNLNSPPCTDSFTRNWQAMILPQLERLKVKVEERAAQGRRDRSCTDFSSPESSSPTRKRKRRMSHSTDSTASASEAESIQKKQKAGTQTAEAGTTPDDVPRSRPTSPAGRTQTPVSRSQTPQSRQGAVTPGDIGVKSEPIDEQDGPQNDIPDNSQRQTPIASNPSPQEETPSGSNRNNNPYRIQPEIIKKIQAEAPRIVERVGATDPAKTMPSAFNGSPGLMHWLVTESPRIIEQAVLANTEAKRTEVRQTSQVSSRHSSTSSVTQYASNDPDSNTYIREAFATKVRAAMSEGQGQSVAMETQGPDLGGQGEVSIEKVEVQLVSKYSWLMDMMEKKKKSKGPAFLELREEMFKVLNQWMRLQALKPKANKGSILEAATTLPQALVPVNSQATTMFGGENVNKYISSFPLPVPSVDQLTKRLVITNNFTRAIQGSAPNPPFPNLRNLLNLDESPQLQTSPSVENAQQTVSPTTSVSPSGQTQNFISPPVPDPGLQRMPMMQTPNNGQTNQQTSSVQIANRIQNCQRLPSQQQQQQQHNWQAQQLQQTRPDLYNGVIRPQQGVFSMPATQHLPAGQSWQMWPSKISGRAQGQVNAEVETPVSSHEQLRASVNQGVRSQNPSQGYGQVQGHGPGQVQGHGPGQAQGRGQLVGGQVEGRAPGHNQVQGHNRGQNKRDPVQWASLLQPGQQQLPSHPFGLRPSPPQIPSTASQYQNIFNIMQK